MPASKTDVRSLEIRVQRSDAHPWLTRVTTMLAAFGLAIAGAMAVWGLPPVDFHGPLHHMGIMDPFCGGTRSAYLTTQGDLAGAWRYNPLGIITVVGAAAILLRTVTGWASGRWLNVHTAFSPAQRRALWTIAALAFVLLAIRQQMQADLLMTWGAGG